MKRYGNLFEKIYSIENLELAYKHAKKGKGWYKEVKDIEKDPKKYLLDLQEMLKTNSYKTSSYETFIKKDSGKEREIYKLPFYPDRICQWAVLQVIEPQLLANFTDDTYSAIPNKGIHDAFKKLRKAVDTVPHEMTYCLKIDCKKFYPSIDHDILKAKYNKKYKDRDLLNLIYEIIDSIDTCPATEENINYYKNKGKEITTVCDPKGNEFIEGIGIPIGNYLSQYSGNFYLSEFDHWIKGVKRIKHYYRYMDDVCIFLDSKEELNELFEEIKLYFDSNLNLRIKENYQIFPSFIRGVDFVGYRVFLHHTLLRESTYRKLKRKMIDIREKVESGEEMNYSEWCSINSYKGWLDHCNGYRLYEKYIQPIKCYADEYYLKNIKSENKKEGKQYERLWNTEKYSAA
ncbi:MAG: RNA-directed DNA polymerase [Lachnospiraceae bacterium]